MARRNNDDEQKAIKRPDRGAQRSTEEEQDKDKEEVEENAKDAETTHMHNTLGNQAIQGLIGDQKGKGEVDTERENSQAQKRKAHEKEGQDYGGDDDADETVGDLEEWSDGWESAIQAPTERAEAVAMPEETLPPEDQALLADVGEFGQAEIRPSEQWIPSATVLAINSVAFVRAAARFAGPSLHLRALAHLATSPGPLLQDPHARVILPRARAALLAQQLLIASIPSPDPSATVGVRMLLDLASRPWAPRAARMALKENQKPVATVLFDALVRGGDERVSPRTPDAAFQAHADVILFELLGLHDPRSLVPMFAERPAEEGDDDPLGLDAQIRNFTGGSAEVDPTFDAMLKAAERVAGLIHLLRLRGAGVASASAEVFAGLGLLPRVDLRDAMAILDGRSSETMQLLREVAKATQKRQVAIGTMRGWLSSAADQIVAIRADLCANLAAIAVGLLPNDPALEPPAVAMADPLDEAIADGTVATLRPWLASLPASLDRDVAAAFVELTVGDDPAPAAERLGALAGLIGDGPIAIALDVGRDAAWLAGGHHAAAIPGARAGIDRALREREPLALAVHGLHLLEAHQGLGEHAGVEALRPWLVKRLHEIGADGPLTLILRWRPPEETA